MSFQLPGEVVGWFCVHMKLEERQQARGQRDAGSRLVYS